MQLIPAGSIVAPAGPRSVLDRLEAAGLGPSAAVRPELAMLTTRARSGLSSVVARDHASASARADTLALARTVGSPAVLVSDDAATAASAHLEGFDVVVAPGEPFVAVPAGWDLSSLPVRFAVVGDVHNCWRSLTRLLAELPSDVVPVLVGDFTDKGGSLDSDAVTSLRLVMDLHRSGRVLAVRGNHEAHLSRALLKDRDPAELRWGLGRTVRALRAEVDAEILIPAVCRWISALPTHLILDGGDLIVAHAAIRPELLGSEDRKDLRSLESACLYGIRPPKGEPQRDESGFPIRVDWARGYTGSATVVHGHVIVPEPTVTGRVVNVDTGCYEGGGLSAFLPDELRFVRVPTHPDDLASVREVELVELD